MRFDVCWYHIFYIWPYCRREKAVVLRHPPCIAKVVLCKDGSQYYEGSRVVSRRIKGNTGTIRYDTNYEAKRLRETKRHLEC